MSTTPLNSTASYVEVELSTTNQRQQQQQHNEASYGKCSLRKLLSTAGIIVALVLIVVAIYMHLKQNHHLGRLYIDLTEAETEEHDVNEVTVPFEVVSAPAVAALGTPPLSENCLECIAATATANNPAKCNGHPCSIYRIYRPYWQDAMGRVDGIDYESCVSEPNCATDTVRAYLASFARDCDGDGLIRCRDHIMLHQLGPTGCMEKPMPATNLWRMSKCLQVKEIQ
ncbi:uncharacterized protein LOC6557404 [Drosophila grimshawi]|uniref:lysozyme n=1 Tax=Drosophila grimshawi TaxID=7222 RepID=B4J358_DROGR|nr:uncharacterized protein LOC6557404 [Drosophila grimshawi]EDV96129.1 GH15386 [Drosophila grimshawi]